MKTSLLAFAATFFFGAVALLADSAPGSSVALRVELDRDVLTAGTRQKAIVKVTLDSARILEASKRPPVNLALVLDRSGSMSGDKIQQAKAAAIEALGRLAADDIFSLVAYDTTIETIIPAQRVGSGRGLAERIEAIRIGGNTALYGGVSQGASELRRNLEDKRYIHRMVLLSDGQANNGPSSPEELGRLGEALLKEGISVTTVGLGLGFNEDLMTRLAQKSDGNTYFVEGSSDLPRIFTAELGDVLNVTARQLVLTVTFPHNVRPVALIGREGVIRDQQVEYTLNQLYGGQEKFALIEVEVTAPESKKLKVAQARLTYDDAATLRSVTKEASATVRFSSEETEVIASANKRVQADYAANVIAQAKDRAVALVDAGRRQEAAAVLRKSADELNVLGRTFENKAVMDVAAANTAEAGRLEKQGLSNAGRKTYRTDNAQTQSQQSSSGNASGGGSSSR